MSGKKGIPQRHKKQKMSVADRFEADTPKTTPMDVWDPEFGWVLRQGKPTNTTAAYWHAMKRKLKQ